MIDEVKQRQLYWYGPVHRIPDDRIARQMMNSTTTDKRKRGWSKITWIISDIGNWKPEKFCKSLKFFLYFDV